MTGPLFSNYGATKPLGLLLAEGIPRASARELASKRNWRIRVVVRELEHTRLEVHRLGDPLRCSFNEHPNRVRLLALAKRKLTRLDHALQELLKQRARVQRNRGRQMTIDWSKTTMPNWTTDEGESLFNDDRTFSERIGVRVDAPVSNAEVDRVRGSVMPRADNPRHSSATFEHGTPPDIVDAAHEIMGGIDLDPASCEKANSYVEAAEYFEKEDNGYRLAWHGRVFLNPPGGLIDATGRPVYIKTKARDACTISGACGLKPGHKHEDVGSSAGRWWKKLALEYMNKHVEQAIFIGFSLEILQTSQVEDDGLPLPLDFPICYPKRRLQFIALDKAGIVPGDAPTHASFIAYLLPRVLPFDARERFVKSFSKFGRVVLPTSKT